MFEGYRMIDLSPELIPGEEDRRLEIRQYIFELDNTYMTDIDIMSHIGVHIEAPSHYKKGLKDVSQLPVEDFLGDAISLNVESVGKGQPITPEDVSRISETGGVRPRDILFLHSPFEGDDVPFISRALAEWMAELPVKMLGIDMTVGLEEKDQMFTHDFLLRKDIAIIERVANLKDVPERFVFIGLPLRIRGIDSSPIRAIALVKEG
ncbi:MAG: hypothetical protein GXP25_13415 [Planctomycetes bacterium]|nr:hypothetical protein [Planctomycetota bacterium]